MCAQAMLWLIVLACFHAHRVFATTVPLIPLIEEAKDQSVSADLFIDLEQHSRIVDISYCVGSTGIQKPFECASRCQDFEAFELITVSCAQVALMIHAVLR